MTWNNETENLITGTMLLKLPYLVQGMALDSVSVWKDERMGMVVLRAVWRDGDETITCEGSVSNWKWNMSKETKSLVESEVDEMCEKVRREHPGTFIVKCTNNIGMEGKFDQGIEYLADPCHTDGEKFLLVYDKRGVPVFCLRDRFDGEPPRHRRVKVVRQMGIFGKEDGDKVNFTIPF